MKLHTSKLVKRYRNRTVVKRVSIEVEQGEIVGLLGPNGAGKTTTVAKLARLLKEKHRKSSLLVSCDIYRPAAIDQLQTLANAPGAIEVEETGLSFAENAALKAIGQARHLGRWVLAEDSGLIVPIGEQLIRTVGKQLSTRFNAFCKERRSGGHAVDGFGNGR